jgi:hypothetical protein
MKEARNAVESAPADNQRASPTRATKMNAASSRLFIDFLFVANRAQLIRCSKDELSDLEPPDRQNMIQITI